MSVAAHIACSGAMVADLLIRTYRLRRFVQQSGCAIPRVDAFVATSFGDAAAALTPWRAAGEPARVFAMVRGGASVAQSVVALTAESVLNYAVVTVAAVLLIGSFGGDYWRALPSGSHLMRGVAIGAVVVTAVGAAAWLVLGHHMRQMTERLVTALRLATDTLRRSPGSLITIGVVTAALSLAARLAILPILAIGLPDRPSLGVLSLASFTLLYGQLLVPSPSGAGVVDAAVLGGAAGIDTETGSLLAAWRLYTTILPTAIGIAAALAHYGRSALSLLRKPR